MHFTNSIPFRGFPLRYNPRLRSAIASRSRLQAKPHNFTDKNRYAGWVALSFFTKTHRQARVVRSWSTLRLSLASRRNQTAEANPCFDSTVNATRTRLLRDALDSFQGQARLLHRLGLAIDVQQHFSGLRPPPAWRTAPEDRPHVAACPSEYM